MLGEKKMKNSFLTRRRLIKCSLSTCEKAQEIKDSPWIESKDICSSNLVRVLFSKKSEFRKDILGGSPCLGWLELSPKGVKRKTLLDSVFLRENRGHLSENLSTKNYSFGAKMRIIRRLPPNGSHPLRIPRNTRAQVKLAKSLAWPKEWGPCCVAFGRARRSHPYADTSYGSGSLPI